MRATASCSARPRRSPRAIAGSGGLPRRVRLTLYICGVGLAEQRLDGVARLGDRHADAGEDLRRSGGQLERLGHHLLQPLGQMPRVLAGPTVTTTNSSPPKRATKSPSDRTPLEPGRQVAQQFVTGAVTEQIVDRLEPIQVDEATLSCVVADGRARPSAVARWRSRAARLGSPVRPSQLASSFSWS